MMRNTVIGHLVEQWRDGIVAPVQDQQQRRNLSLPEVEQLVLLGDDLLMTDRQSTNTVKYLDASKSTEVSSATSTTGALMSM